MDAIKRDRSNLFWSEWETVTERTRHLLKRHTGHSIMLTVDPCALSYAKRQYKYQHKRKAADCANSQDRRKGGSIWQLSTPNHTTIRKGKQMNEERTITISTEEYAELMMCRTRLNILATYAEQNERTSYLDREFIALIIGAKRKEEKA